MVRVETIPYYEKNVYVKSSKLAIYLSQNTMNIKQLTPTHSKRGKEHKKNKEYTNVYSALDGFQMKNKSANIN